MVPTSPSYFLSVVGTFALSSLVHLTFWGLQDISNDLMQYMAVLSAAEPLSAADVATKKTIVSYFPPQFNHDTSVSPILIRESPYLLGASSSVGFRTWEACLNLAHYLSAKGQMLVEGKNVIELGAGTGLLSIFCAGPLRANYVLSTDGISEVVSSIEHNVMLNKALLTQNNNGVPVIAKLLDWTDHSPLSTVLSVSQTDTELSSIPHHTSSLSIPKYDLILGADITYNLQYFGPLVATLSILEAYFPGIDIVLAAAVRNINTFYSFLEACDEEGFEVEDVEFDCPSFHQQQGFFHNIALPIRIVKIIRKNPRRRNEGL